MKSKGQKENWIKYEREKWEIWNENGEYENRITHEGLKGGFQLSKRLTLSENIVQNMKSSTC